jgi:hypothetical protein
MISKSFSFFNFVLASINGNVSALNAALNSGADINFKRTNGETFAHAGKLCVKSAVYLK